jgi:DNA-binding NtrC family response regulator
MSELPVLLFVDDEERILRSLRMLFRGRAEILCTTRGQQAIDWIRSRTVHVVVSDQRMPGMTGVALLREVARHSPRTMRILLTGYADIDAVTASVNEGEIFRFVEKPWDSEKLVASVMRAAAIARQELAFTHAGARNAAVPIAISALAIARALVLDPSHEVSRLVRDIVPESIEVTLAQTIEDALGELLARDYAVIVAVLSSDAGDIIEAIKQLKKLRPATLVIAISPLKDSRLTISLINEGQIFRFLLAPPGRELLRRCLVSAFERNLQLRSTPELAARHEVEVSRAPQASISGRLLDYWRRLREGVARQ